jgi:hypothetical protein
MAIPTAGLAVAKCRNKGIYRPGDGDELAHVRLAKQERQTDLVRIAFVRGSILSGIGFHLQGPLR